MERQIESRIERLYSRESIWVGAPVSSKRKRWGEEMGGEAGIYNEMSELMGGVVVCFGVDRNECGRN